MKLKSLYPGAELYRVEKMIFIRFSKPHHLLSSARTGGGYRSSAEVEYIGICQGCEPHGGHHGFYASDPAGPPADEPFGPPPVSSVRMLRRLTRREGIPPGRFVALETAADTQNAGIEVVSRKSLTVAAVCTAGVETNALRAGDPAAYDEDELKMNQPGTINILLAVDRILTPGAMTTAVITATEAKSAALGDLNVGSTASSRLATGTGTDQIAVASLSGPAAEFDRDTAPLLDAGKHSLLGELIGRAVTAAVKRGLELQNGYSPGSRGLLSAQVRRFGYTPKEFRSLLVRTVEAAAASGGTAAVLEANFDEVDRKPGVTAAAGALIRICDLARSGVLPLETGREEAGLFGAQIAASTADRPSATPMYLEKLDPFLDEFSLSDPVVFISRCIALGYTDKWR